MALMALVPFNVAFAQEKAPQPEPETVLHARTLDVTISFWKGTRISRSDGALVDLGYFGGGYQAIFRESANALASMRSYEALRISGTICNYAGFAAMTAMLSLSIAGKMSFGSTKSLPLLIPAGVLQLSSVVLLHAADAYLSDAVHQYNKDITRSAGEPVEGRSAGNGTRGVGISYGFAF
jgi:hypothetical protein